MRKSALGARAGTRDLLEKLYCKAQCDSLSVSGLFNTALAKTKQKVIDLCQPAVQNRVESIHYQSATSSFLPPLPISFQNPFHHLHIHLFSYLWHGPLFLVLHTCINKPTTDFRRSLSLFSHSSFHLISLFFPSSSRPQNKPVTSGLSVIIKVFCSAH